MKTESCAKSLKQEIAKIIVGKEEQISLILTAVFAAGHVLLDDSPGSGKTTLAKTMAKALGCGFQRIQFTPDLLPSDIVGMSVFDGKTGEFRRIQGPVFTHILLADEINRAIPRTQSALLEAMEERQVTIDSRTYPLPDPFFVLATQNPVERESTFPLPEAEMDRFFLRLSLGFPDREEERIMLQTLGDGVDFSTVESAANPQILRELREEIRAVHVSEYVLTYIVDLVARTREHPSLNYGGSPRASRCLYQGGKARAAMCGRDYVTPEDVAALFLPVLGHRVILNSEARYQRLSPGDILRGILSETPIPPERKEFFH